MAGTPVTVKVTGTLPTSLLCILEIMAPPHHALVLRGLDFTEGGADGTDAHTVLTTTLGGTATNGTPGTAPTVSKGDVDQTLTLRTVAGAGAADGATNGSARANFSANPTSTNEVQAPIAGQSPARLGLPPWRGYIRIKPSTAFRVFAIAEAANPFTCVAYIEE